MSIEELVQKQIDDLANRIGQLERRPKTSYKIGTWTPTLAGFLTNPTIVIARYILDGKKCTCFVSTNNGTSNATNFTISAPFTAATVANHYWGGVVWLYYDNSLPGTAVGSVYIGSAGTVFTLRKTADSDTSWTAANLKGAKLMIDFEIA